MYVSIMMLIKTVNFDPAFIVLPAERCVLRYNGVTAIIKALISSVVVTL